MMFEFISNSRANLKLEFISGFTVDAQLQKSPVFCCLDFFSKIADVYYVASELYEKNLVFLPQLASKKPDLRN